MLAFPLKKGNVPSTGQIFPFLFFPFMLQSSEQCFCSFFFVRIHKREYWLPIPHLIYHTNTIVLCAEAHEAFLDARTYIRLHARDFSP